MLRLEWRTEADVGALVIEIWPDTNRGGFAGTVATVNHEIPSPRSSARKPARPAHLEEPRGAEPKLIWQGLCRRYWSMYGTELVCPGWAWRGLWFVCRTRSSWCACQCGDVRRPRVLLCILCNALGRLWIPAHGRTAVLPPKRQIPRRTTSTKGLGLQNA